MSCVGQVITPVVTNVASLSSPSTMSLPTPTVTSPGSAQHSINPNRGPTQTLHQAVTSQGARFKTHRLVTHQEVVQLLDMIDEELQCEETTQEANSMKEVHEIVEEFQDSCND